MLIRAGCAGQISRLKCGLFRSTIIRGHGDLGIFFRKRLDFFIPDERLLVIHSQVESAWRDR